MPITEMTDLDKNFIQVLANKGATKEQAFNAWTKWRATQTLPSPLQTDAPGLGTAGAVVTNIMQQKAAGVPTELDKRKEVVETISETSPTVGAVTGQIQRALPGARENERTEAIKDALKEKTGTVTEALPDFLQKGIREARDIRSDRQEEISKIDDSTFLGKMNKADQQFRGFLRDSLFSVGLPLATTAEAGVGAVLDTAADVQLPLGMPTEDGIDFLVSPREIWNQIKKVTPVDIKEEASKKIEEFQKFYDGLDPGLQSALKETGALFRVVGTISGASGVAQKPLTQKIVSGAIKKGDELVEAVTKPVLEGMAQRQISKLESAIEEGIEKGIKPSLTGKKKTITGLNKWKDDARTAVNSIIGRKDALKLADEFGEVVSGSPQTLKQFADAIEQTKASIFKEYDSLAIAAGGSGKTIKLSNVTDELKTIVENKVLNVERPDIVAYAKARIDAYKGVTYAPAEAQEAIKVLNQSLDSFYRNPSFDTASKAYVDSLIANRMRSSLDELVSSLTGSQYQSLKNEYAALKSIEKDVVHRALVDARKNTKGLLDFTDVFSGGEVVSGLLSMNPAMVAKGVAQKGIKDYLKFQNNPNTQIKRVFEKAESVKGLSKPGSSGFKSGGNPPTTDADIKSFKRDASLTGTDKVVQENAIKKYVQNKEKMIDEFLRKNVKIINTDDARREFIDVGYNGSNSKAVHEASSALSKAALKKKLSNSPEEVFTLFAGGSGTGKTSAITKTIPGIEAKSAAILDGNLSSYEKALGLLKQGRDAGKIPRIYYTYRDIIESFEKGVVKRMIENKKEMGRIVPIGVHIKNHKGSLDTIKKVVNNKDATYVLIDNSLGKGNQKLLPLGKLNSIKYEPASVIRKKLESIIDNLHANGTISAEQRRAYFE